tara:strand:+ start:4893 stop:5969 length:1077 start_codon:yes stop_codon:yes gene_type:complete
MVSLKSHWLLFVVIASSIVVGSVQAVQGADGDGSVEVQEGLMALDLEELMNLRVSSTEVMGINHTHPEGEWMFGYKYQHTKRKGYKDGTKTLSVSDVFDRGYTTVPTEMRMEMHLVHLMYGLSDNLTLMAMLPYMRKSMDHVKTPPGLPFTAESEGIGDIKAMGLYTFFKRKHHRIQLTGGLSLPSGSIDTKSSTGAQLEYPMQLGSGTVDFCPAITYSGQSSGDDWYWGTHAEGTIRLGENNRDYTLGNRLTLTTWATRMWSEWMSTSIRLDGHVWGDIDGADPRLEEEKEVEWTRDPDLADGKRVDLLLGVNVFQQEGKLKGHRVSVEAGFPIYEWLDGPQLGVDWILRAGWQWAF